MNIVLIGPEGAGKTSLSIKIAEHYDLNHIEIGDLIRKEAKKTSPKAEIIDHLVNQKGKLLPDGVVTDILVDNLNQFQCDNLIFDGYPRTNNQYFLLKDLLTAKNTKIDAVFFLSLSDAQAVERVISRGRPDDTPQVIASKIEDYHRLTEPMFSHIKKDNLLIEIDASKPSDEVFQQIKKHIDNLIVSKTQQIAQQTKRLYIVIHCESVYNQKGIYTGPIDVELSQRGHEKCQLTSLILKNEPIDIAYRSSLKRTEQTLEHIMKYHPNIEVNIDDRLIERSNGIANGKLKKEIKENQPELYQIVEDSYREAPPEGESMIQVEQRVIPALREILDRIKRDKVNIIIVSHDKAIRPIRGYLEKLTPQEMIKLDHQRHRIFTYDIPV